MKHRLINIFLGATYMVAFFILILDLNLWRAQ